MRELSDSINHFKQIKNIYKIKERQYG